MAKKRISFDMEEDIKLQVKQMALDKKLQLQNFILNG